MCILYSFWPAADKEGVHKDDFPLAKVPRSGEFRLVEDSVLEAILSTSQWFKILKIPPTGMAALGFAVRFFRISADLSVTDLSKKSGVHRNQISSIESGTLKRRPHLDTLQRLSSVLGSDFKNVVKLQGFLD